jgi:methylmalonyl-CoA mutase cobalamin-binding domain/chain
LIDVLRREGAADILVICGGVIPPKGYDFLKRAGVAAIYGPGTNIPQSRFRNPLADPQTPNGGVSGSQMRRLG